MNSLKFLPFVLTLLVVFPSFQANAQIGRRLLNGQGERNLKPIPILLAECQNARRVSNLMSRQPE